MLIKEESSDSEFQIKQYEPGKIWINDVCYEQSIIVSPQKLLLWGPVKLSELTPESFQTVWDIPFDILLLGTGEKLIIPSQKLMALFYEKNKGFEFMDTRAACHTYQALICEDRKVVACLLV